MKITCVTTFRDGTNTYTAGEIRIVDDDTGRRFCELGWAERTDGIPIERRMSPAEATLIVQDIIHRVSSPMVGG